MQKKIKIRDLQKIKKVFVNISRIQPVVKFPRYIKKLQIKSSMDEETYQHMKTVIGLPRMQSTPKRSDALCSTLNNIQISKKRGLEERSSSTMNKCD